MSRIDSFWEIAASQDPRTNTNKKLYKKITLTSLWAGKSERRRIKFCLFKATELLQPSQAILIQKIIEAGSGTVAVTVPRFLLVNVGRDCNPVELGSRRHE
jgi:hypothetical protein